MRNRNLFLGCVGLALVLAGFGCGGSAYRTATAAPPPAFTTTVTTLITQKTSDTTQPEKLENLDLTGAETEDPHAFDAVLASK